jgi:DnaJ-class molecular chaperone
MNPTKAFKILGLDTTATLDQVKERWRELAMAHHPDRGGDHDVFVELTKAYKIARTEASILPPCSACGGSGRVKLTRGFNTVSLPCDKCSN